MNKHFIITVTFAVLLLLQLSSCLKSKDDETPGGGGGGTGGGTYTYKWEEIADSAQTSINYFWNAGGKYFTSNNNSSNWTNYWPTAHGLDVLTDMYMRKPSAALKERMDAVITGVKAKNSNTYINYYYDDMEWMALACLRAFKATNDAQYKDVAQLLWADIKGGWSTDLGGGIWWRKDNPSKNAPSNLPAAILATRLYREFNNADDLEWAKKIYNWQKDVLYEPNSGWVYDNIDAAGNKNTSWKFTYNQGTFIGAALELYLITNSSLYINDAIKAADYTVSSGQLTDIANGILKDEGGGDGGLFKGIFVRYFNRLIIDGNLESSKKTQYINFLKTNAQKLWNGGTNKSQILFGTAWNTQPGATTDFTTQVSGVMLMEAMAELKKLNLVN